MNAEEVKARLAGRWPDDRYLHVYEAPLDAHRQGSKIDVLILSLWQSDRYEVDAVEVKVSYSDWCKEWREVSWVLTDHVGTEHTFSSKPNGWQLARFIGGTDEARLWWRLEVPPPEGFEPTVERRVRVNTRKNREWRDRAHRFWIAAPDALAAKIVADVRQYPEMAGWGVLAVGETQTRVALTPTVRKDRQPFSHQQWLGIVRAAADSGLQALDRARRSGYRQAEEDAKARAFAAAQREAIADMRLPL